jgi:hypothetical protein
VSRALLPREVRTGGQGGEAGEGRAGEAGGRGGRAERRRRERKRGGRGRGEGGGGWAGERGSWEPGAGGGGDLEIERRVFVKVLGFKCRGLQLSDEALCFLDSGRQLFLLNSSMRFRSRRLPLSKQQKSIQSQVNQHII